MNGNEVFHIFFNFVNSFPDENATIVFVLNPFELNLCISLTKINFHGRPNKTHAVPFNASDFDEMEIIEQFLNSFCHRTEVPSKT